MTKRTTPPFRADHVGSFLRPAQLLAARERCQKTEISKAELRAATKELNEALHQASLDFWVDPQFFYGRPILTTYEILGRATWRSQRPPGS